MTAPKLTTRERIRRGGSDYLTINRLIEVEALDAADQRQLVRDSLEYIDYPESGPRRSVRDLMRESGLL